MPQDHPSTESTVRRSLTVRIGALVVAVMLAAYIYAYVRVGRQDLLSDNIDWFRTVVSNVLSR
jgi:hypothetical protein